MERKDVAEVDASSKLAKSKNLESRGAPIILEALGRFGGRMVAGMVRVRRIPMLDGLEEPVDEPEFLRPGILLVRPLLFVPTGDGRLGDRDRDMVVARLKLELVMSTKT